MEVKRIGEPRDIIYLECTKEEFIALEDVLQSKERICYDIEERRSYILSLGGLTPPVIAVYQPAKQGVDGS